MLVGPNEAQLRAPQPANGQAAHGIPDNAHPNELQNQKERRVIAWIRQSRDAHDGHRYEHREQCDPAARGGALAPRRTMHDLRAASGANRCALRHPGATVRTDKSLHLSNG
jgi:hypothetical protein